VQKRYVSVREYAAAYGVSSATVYAMCAQGKLPHVRLGTGRGVIRIAKDAAERDQANERGLPELQTALPKPRRVNLRHLRTPS
jgi:excisionase family DNA binding protein